MLPMKQRRACPMHKSRRCSLCLIQKLTGIMQNFIIKYYLPLSRNNSRKFLRVSLTPPFFCSRPGQAFCQTHHHCKFSQVHLGMSNSKLFPAWFQVRIPFSLLWKITGILNRKRKTELQQCSIKLNTASL